MQPGAPQRREWHKRSAAIAAVVAMAASSIGVGIASADSGGGGVGPADPPELSDVVCLDQCAGEREATVGSRVRLAGRNLDGVEEVKFAGGGKRISVAPSGGDSTSVEAKVPDGAVTGTVKVNAFGSEDETPRKKLLTIVGPEQIPDESEFKLTSAEATPHQTYYDGVRSPKVSYLYQGPKATDVRVEVIDRETREAVSTWVDEDAEPSTVNIAKWNGRTTAGTLAQNGEYAFRIASVAGGEAETTADSRFGFYKFKFPLVARHSYGDGYGAGRNHQGQDVFARCGSGMFAARGGRVQFNKTHSAAGNYVVIDGKGTKMDFMYAHLMRRSPLKAGARVRTGQRIGQVGDTGNASGCHLHFEVWSAPGWYEGGHALPSVGKLLKTWDAWS